MNNSIKGHLCIVFALEHYNPLGMIRGLGQNGINPIYISVKRRGEVATKSKYISKLYRVNTVEEGYQLLMEQYGNYDFAHRPIVLFSDDKSCGYFDARYEEVEKHFITYNAKRNGRISEFMDKYKVQKLAEKHGLHVLKSFVVEPGEIPEELVYPIITKDISPNSGAWKSDVFICHNEDELRIAYTKITSPEILLQHFVDKKNELAIQGYTIHHGKEAQFITAMNWKYLIQGYYSPYHDVYMVKDEDMKHSLQKMFEEIGYEGVFEAEFLIDKDNIPYFLEINFRASAWNHTTNFAGMAESYLWVKGMLNGYIDEKDRKEFETFTSMSEIIDYGKRVDTGKISLAEWIKDFKEAKCTYYYHKDDLGPWEYVQKNWDEYK
ncbi:hypothetical protein [Selenomonas montiformis]|uniref:hypothetical protein n=1 Tax=Selenomonas montiformis TaxID=2652285 RepID=UPI0039F60A1D